MTQDTFVCPCGSALPYARCCGALHRGEATPDSPESLMRSRYTAFALGGLGDYLLSTWEPSTRDPSLTAQSLSQRDVVWEGLEILDSRVEGMRGSVEFKAHFRPLSDPAAGQQVLHERSRFRCRGGVWRYVDGVIDPPANGVSRNAPCPCGSGKKAKRCCHR